MKLSKLSLLFSATLLLIVGINGSISILVLNAFNRAQAEQDHRLRLRTRLASEEIAPHEVLALFEQK